MTARDALSGSVAGERGQAGKLSKNEIRRVPLLPSGVRVGDHGEG
jgi:hypothetical protein